MTVYVDQFGEGWGRWTGGGHMLGTDLDELHAMAAYLGLRLAWFQDKTFAHYDLTRNKRSMALRAGAVPIDLFDDRMPDDVLMKNGDGTYETYAERMSRRKKVTIVWKAFMSNFYIEPDGTHVEAEYQAAKHAGFPWRQAVIRRSTPKQARRLGRRWRLSNYQLMEWHNRRDQVMYRLVSRKFDDHPELATALVSLPPELEFVERNQWHDNYWGDCMCMRCYRKGENKLGIILMDIRDEYAEIPERARRAA